MKVTRGLRSLAIPVLVFSCLCLPAKDASAFTVETRGVLDEPSVSEDAFSPDPARYLAFAVRMRGLGSAAEAKLALRDMRSLYPGTDWDRRAALIQGLIALDEGDEAAASFLEDASGIGAIDDYILFFHAEALMRGGRFVEAAGAYDFIIASYPASTLKEKASFRRALALLRSGDGKAAAAFKGFISEWPRSAHKAEANLRLAESLIGQGLLDEAIAPLKEVSTAYPASSFAIESDFLLSDLDFKAKGAESFTPAERFRRAENFFVAASYTRALPVYATLVAEKEFRDRALFRMAVANARLKRYKESEKTLRLYIATKKPSKEAEALYWLALVSMRQGRDEGVFEAERLLSKKHPGSDERAKVLMFIAGMKARKDPEGALLAYRTVLDQFRSSAVSDEAFWKIGWDAYSSGRIADAYDNFSMYLDARPRGRLSSQFLYWQARSAERLGMVEEARVLLDRVCQAAPRSFYCLMAEVRTSGAGPAPEEVVRTGSAGKSAPVPAVARQEGEAARAPESAFRGDPRHQAAEELLMLGLGDEASAEIDLLAGRYSSDRASLAELAGMLYEAGDFYRAFRIYRTHLVSSSEPGHIALGFPLRLVETVKGKAARKSADPFLVAAVMREESHFNPSAVSPVGAMGLMQIMPATGRQIAKELGEGLGTKGLLEPSTSIRFGSWYLGSLMERFEGDAVLTIAGYNAGPNAAARWAGSLPTETDEFVESIPYEETRGYVKKVLRSYAEFLRLAGEDFSERVLRPSPPGSAPVLSEASAGGAGEVL